MLNILKLEKIFANLLKIKKKKKNYYQMNVVLDMKVIIKHMIDLKRKNIVGKTCSKMQNYLLKLAMIAK